MKAFCWQGSGEIRHDTVEDLKSLHSKDVIIRVSTCAICGSDLHIFDGFMPHPAILADGPALYRSLRNKKAGCIKVVVKP